MKNCARFLFLLAIASAPLYAADDAKVTALKAADDERVAAIIAGDKDKMNANFSDELRYAHSNGNVDTKASYVDSITSGKLKYSMCEYEERNFTFPAPGIALMAGRAHFKAKSASGEMDAVLGFLAVWREENGKWRFLAWQSCRVQPPAPAAK